VLSWWSSYTPGDPIRERTVLVFILGLLLWNLAAWLVWWTLRRRQALIGAIPLGLFLALIVDHSGLSLGYLQSFTFFIFVSHVSFEIIARYSDWFDRNIDHPEELEVEWSVSALVIIGLVIFSARAFPLLATPQGWDTIRDWLHRDDVAVVARREAFGGQSKSVKTAFPTTPQLEIIGDPPAKGESVVMWVQISDPPPLQEGISGSLVPPQHYWRGRIYTTYTGRGWKPLEASAYSTEPESTGIPQGRYPLDQTYTLDATRMDALYAVNQPYAIIDSSGERPLVGEGIIPTTQQGLYTYTIQSWATSSGLSELQAAPSIYPEQIEEIYLQLPENLPARVVDLSIRLTRGLSNNYEKARRIETYLRANYPYDLNIPEAPENRDVVDYFLFEAEGGFCSYYASAMVVMMRSIGIPARVVTGYAMGSYDPEMAAYKVVESDSHAWVEVYFPNLGWVEFEPTANRVSFTHSNQVPTSETTDEASIAANSSSKWRLIFIIGGAGLLAVAILVGIRVRKRFRRDRWGFQNFGTAGLVYLEMRNILDQIGFHGHPAQTPHEYLHELERELASVPVVLQSLQQVTETYTRVRFGGYKLSRDGARDLQRMWNQRKRAWMSFSLKYRTLTLHNHLIGRIHRINTKIRRVLIQ
jgi:transglutaminase-like putative cysteine protease